MKTIPLISVNSSNVWKPLKTKSEKMLNATESIVNVQKLSLNVWLLGSVMISKVMLLKSLLTMNPTVIMPSIHKINSTMITIPSYLKDVISTTMVLLMLVKSTLVLLKPNKDTEILSVQVMVMLLVIVHSMLSHVKVLITVLISSTTLMMLCLTMIPTVILPSLISIT